MPSIDDLKKQIKKDTFSLTQDSISLTKDSWENMPKAQRIEFLNTFGFHKSFAEPKTADELVKRGGGMVLRDLHRVVKKWQEKNPTITRIYWGDLPK